MEPFRYNDLEALSTALPTDIESRKEFGDFDGEARLIEQWLQKDISENLKAKLRVEREILKRLPSDYPYSFEEAYERAKTVIKDLTPEQFRELQDKAKITVVSGTSIIEGGAHDVILKDKVASPVK